MVGMISYAGFVQFLEFKSHMIFRPGMSWNQAMVLESHGNVNSWWNKFVDDLCEWVLESEVFWSHLLFICTFVTSTDADDRHLHHICICYNRHVRCKMTDNLYNVPFQCVVKVALTVLKSRGNTPQKVLESVENYWRCSVRSLVCEWCSDDMYSSDVIEFVLALRSTTCATYRPCYQPNSPGLVMILRCSVMLPVICCTQHLIHLSLKLFYRCNELWQCQFS